MKWDIFISYASEDKEEIVKPVATALRERRISVWFDDFVLKPGDSIRGKIDLGLAESNIGIIVLSQHFFNKNWTLIELGALVSLHAIMGKRIIPLLHNVDISFLAKKSPILSDIKGIQTSIGINAIVDIITEIALDNFPVSNEARKLLIDEFGNVSGLDSLFISNVSKALQSNDYPCFYINFHKTALYNGIGLSVLRKANYEFHMFIYGLLPEQGDMRLLLKEILSELEDTPINRKISSVEDLGNFLKKNYLNKSDIILSIQKIYSVVNHFYRKIELGICYIASGKLKSFFSREKDAAVVSNVYISALLYRAKGSANPPFCGINNHGIRFNFWNNKISNWRITISISKEEISLYEIPVYGKISADDCPNDLIVRCLIPAILYEAFYVNEMDSLSSIEDHLFNLRNWYFGLA